MKRPRLIVTLGDVAGIGPEIVVRAWPQLTRLGDIVVAGDRAWLESAARRWGHELWIREVKDATEASGDESEVAVIQATAVKLNQVRVGRVSAEAGRAAFDFLCRAIDETVARRADAIVTAPLHKEGLHAAGLAYPGHTEILADKTGATRHAMLLHGRGITVGHVTLHMSLREALQRITTDVVRTTIRLVHRMASRLTDETGPRIAVAALNPHASDGGLFGREESEILGPAVEAARREGLPVVGPLPADTLFVRADRGEFNAVVAMYHDQGHIPMKLRCGWDLVNITAGLPIIRTSVAHGTAYDIAEAGVADPTSLIAAAKVAARLVSGSPEGIS